MASDKEQDLADSEEAGVPRPWTVGFDYKVLCLLDLSSILFVGLCRVTSAMCLDATANFLKQKSIIRNNFSKAIHVHFRTGRVD